MADGLMRPRGRLFMVGVLLCGLSQTPAGSQVTEESTASHQRMLALLQQIADETPDRHEYLGDARARRAQRGLNALGVDADLGTRWEFLLALGQAELELGDESAAITHFEEARQIVDGTSVELGLTPWIVTTLFRLGVAYLRLGETQNCALHPAASSCILPLRGDSIHREQDPARRAIATFTEGLERTPEDNPLFLIMRWLVNIAYMTVGEYPDQVPERVRIPPHAFESESDMPRFTNVAPVLAARG